jgi:hypothetical protein
MSSLRVLNKIAKDKSLRILFVGFFLFFMVWQPTPAYAEVASATITCMDSAGGIITRQIGWDNENNYFVDKGNIPQHYCEGGFAGRFTTFVGVVSSDGSELDPALLYHPSYVADPPDDTEVNPEPEPSPVPPTEEVATDDVERPDEETPPTEPETEEPVGEPEPVPSVAPITPSPEPTQEQVIEPAPEPTTEPEPEPSPESPVRPVEPTKPPEVITPTPDPVEPSTSPTEPTIPTEPTPEPSLPEVEETQGIGLALEAVGKLINNLRSIGSDMTPEVREQAQQVIVASVIVTQIAMAGRKP